MHRRRLLELLGAHTPYDEAERTALRRTVEFVESEPACFERSLSAGHVTGSSWIVDRGFDRVLLTHHRKLDMWLQLGGHADGDTDVLRVAIREAAEESGLATLEAVYERIFDVDVHRIPSRGGEPEHFHYDVRFLLYADPAAPLVITAESKDLGWLRLEDVRKLGVDDSVLRMVAKTRALASPLRCGPTKG